ncbi:imidazole glycerol phosphate synthase subunit HisH [Paenibacillus sp. FSL H8-0034]|uniref:imidazole glycerol phosphate synthase subunit HisH n=1 Tax=Paenibacillus sp. FSL H8-0034 TaxID=2954671 RepID=UPI0030FB8290
MNVVIIDYGMGNLISVKRALEECGADVTISSDLSVVEAAGRLVLPGVGAFPDGMAELRSRGLDQAILAALQNASCEILGICLGMQLLATVGFEGSQTEGLNLIPGKVERLQPLDENDRIPHVGWNELSFVQHDPIFNDLPDGSDFYFVHSYHFIPENDSDIIATTPYCGNFVSMVRKNNIYGVQFHPEKSQQSGFKIIRNFLGL